jgi:hypothetical protein
MTLQQEQNLHEHTPFAAVGGLHCTVPDVARAFIWEAFRTGVSVILAAAAAAVRCRAIPLRCSTHSLAVVAAGSSSDLGVGAEVRARVKHLSVLSAKVASEWLFSYQDDTQEMPRCTANTRVRMMERQCLGYVKYVLRTSTAMTADVVRVLASP